MARSEKGRWREETKKVSKNPETKFHKIAWQQKTALVAVVVCTLVRAITSIYNSKIIDIGKFCFLVSLIVACPGALYAVLKAQKLSAWSWAGCVGLLSFFFQGVLSCEVSLELMNIFNLLLMAATLLLFIAEETLSIAVLTNTIFFFFMTIQKESGISSSTFTNLFGNLLLYKWFSSQSELRGYLEGYRTLWLKAREKQRGWKLICFQGQTESKVIFSKDKLLLANKPFQEYFTQDFLQLKEKLEDLTNEKAESLWSLIQLYIQVGVSDMHAFYSLGEFGKKSQKYFEAQIKQFPFRGQKDTYLMSLHDVTAIKKKQKELLGKHYRSILVNTASHELMTPMNGILGGLQLIENSENLEDVRHCCKVMNASCKLLLNTTKDMIDYCMCESGTLTLEFEECNLKNLMKEAVSIIEFQAQERGVKVELILGEGLPEHLLVDKKRLMQIFLNLLFNAAKYTFKGEIKFCAQPEVDNILISIEDTGIGISEEGKNYLFKLFGQLEKRKHERDTFLTAGAGLGLTVSQALAKNFGTKIKFVSEVNKGSRFYFNLPNEIPRVRSTIVRFPSPELSRRKPYCGLPLFRRAYSRCPDSRENNAPYGVEDLKLMHSNISMEADNMSLGEAERNEESPCSDFRKYQIVMRNSFSEGLPTVPCHCPDILIVDDNGFNLYILQRLLKKLNLESQKASNGEEAISKIVELSSCACRKPMCILMDCEMPIKNGYQASEELVSMMSENIVPEIPIIACTAYNDEEHRKACFESGMKGFLSKPVMFIELKNTLKNLHIIS